MESRRRSRRSWAPWLTIAIASVPALCGVTQAAPPACPGGRFLLVEQPALVPGTVAPAIQVVIIGSGTVAIADRCPPVTARFRSRRRGTRLRAKWPKGTCAGFPGKLVLAARLDPTCTTLDGKVKAKRSKMRFTAQLSACGDGILDREADEVCPQLEEPDDALAVEATVDLDAPAPIPAVAHDVDARGAPLVRTRIEIVFTAAATVAQVNALITGVAGRIVSMLEGVPSVVLDLPDPGSVAALDALVAQLSSDPVVRFVLKAYERAPDVLPSNYTASLADPEAARLDHQLAVRAAAAWNARAAMGQSPTVAVLDHFGDGAPNGDFDLIAPSPSDFTSAGQGDDGEHGYHVLGIITGRAGGPNTARGQATGMFPGTAAVRVADIRDPNADSLTDDNRVLERLRSGTPHGVLNTSLGASCGRLELDLAREATWWAEKVRALGLESRVLHLTSAGNIKSFCPTEIDAFTNSSYSASALLPLAVANLTNVLVVENAVNGGRPTFAPRCLNESSKVPGHLAAIGTAVFSLTDASSRTGNMTGTSMATPQVAGLAAYLWSLAPAMTVQQVRHALLATASAPVGGGEAGCAPITSAPVIDAYAAVLSLDAAALPDPALAPVRQAILDADESGRFDDADLTEFVGALIDPLTGDPREPTAPDFGRHDLNGDGFTGGAQRTAPFDLDRVDSVQFGASGHRTVLQTMAGIDVPFDETLATDLDILCYYAYSDLFEGTQAARDQALPVARCLRARVTAVFPTQVTPGVATALDVRVAALRPDGTDLVPLAGVHVEVTASGGTVGTATGIADGQGAFQTTVTASTAGVVTVGVVVRTAPGGTVLAQTSVQATASGPAVECMPPPQALALSLFISGVPSRGVGGEAGEALSDSLEADGRRVAAQVSMGSGHVTAQLDEAPISQNQGVSAQARFADTFVVTPQNPALVGAAGSLTALVEVTASGSVSSDMFATWTFSSSVEQRSGTFGPGGYSGDPPGAFEMTLPITFGQPSAPFFFLTGSAGALASTTGAAQIDAAFVVSGFPAARDAGGTPVPFSLCSNVPPPSMTTSTTTPSSTSTSTTPTTMPSTTTTLPGPDRDPYRVYGATGPDGPAVDLSDQFRTEHVDLGPVVFFLPPVGIDGASFLGQTIAQACYTYSGAPFVGTADVVHRLASQSLQLGDPVALCVPSEATGIAADAYACHAATGDALAQSHTLTDDFQMQVAANVLAPFLFCVPVSVDGAVLLRPAEYLTCYLTDPPGMPAGAVGIDNVFHAGVVDTSAAVGLCVPTDAVASESP